MFWKLTDNIWWGDWNSLLETKDEVASVICLASNSSLAFCGYNPMVLNHKIRYFRFAEGDLVFPEQDYFAAIEEIIRICLWPGNDPLLIHCYAGMHRSPIIAIFAALIKFSIYSDNREAQDFIEEKKRLFAKAEKLNPKCSECWKFNFSVGTQQWIDKRISEQFCRTV